MKIHALLVALFWAVVAGAGETVSVMTFNIWGDYFGNPVSERDSKEVGVILR